MGLRFKSTTRENFDLCSECFCKNQGLHGQSNEFKLIPMDWANMWWKKHTKQEVSWEENKQAWKAWMKGKGKGKGKDHEFKGKGKGHEFKGKGKDHKGKGRGKDHECKGKGKRSAWDAELDVHGSSPKAPRAEAVVAKKCARPDCNFQCTWHPTHCCAACKGSGDKGPHKHGPKCDKKCLPVVIATPVVEDDVKDDWALVEGNVPSAPSMELLEVNEKETALKARQLEEMGFGAASEMTEVLKSCGGDLSKALEALTI